jgi:hypothetical protein
MFQRVMCASVRDKAGIRNKNPQKRALLMLPITSQDLQLGAIPSER